MRGSRLPQLSSQTQYTPEAPCPRIEQAVPQARKKNIHLHFMINIKYDSADEPHCNICGLNINMHTAHTASGSVEVHRVHAALFIEDVCADLRSDHIILSHLTSSTTSIKQYAQLRLVLENERQTYSEFPLRFPSQTPLLLVHRFRPPFQATTAAPVSGCPAACQTRRQTEESSRSRPRSPRVSYLTFRPPVATNVPRSTALNLSLSNSQSVNQVPVTRRFDTRPGTPARRLAACGGARELAVAHRLVRCG